MLFSLLVVPKAKGVVWSNSPIVYLFFYIGTFEIGDTDLSPLNFTYFSYLFFIEDEIVSRLNLLEKLNIPLLFLQGVETYF